MTISDKCPTADQIERFVFGKMSDADLGALEEHMSACPHCQDSVHALETNDTLVKMLRRPGATTGRPEADIVASLIEQLKSLPPPTGSGQSAPLESAVPETERSDFLPSLVEAVQLADGMEGGAATLAPDSLSFLGPARGPEELGGLGPYRILRILGAGGMGVVFVAEDPQLKRTVALKTMRPGLAGHKDARKRFLREAQAVAGLNHDHIVSVYQVGEDRGIPYLAMPLLTGESLETRLRREPILASAEILRIGREIAEGLAAAHAHGLIHRDIKPGNVWLEKRAEVPPGQTAREPESLCPTVADFATVVGAPRVKILDFGLARIASAQTHLTQAGVVVGSPAYMAPEQARGEAVDVRSDLFSLGCILYRMSTGRLAFAGKDMTATLLALALDNPPSPCAVNPQVPPMLSALVMELLTKDPEGRPGSARGVAESLARIERDPMAPVPAVRARKPWRWRTAVACAALLLAAAVSLQIYLRITRSDGSTQEIEVKPGDKFEVVERKAGAPKIEAKEKKPGPPVPRANGPLFFKDDFDGAGPVMEPLFGEQFMTFERKDGAGRLTGKTGGVLPVLYTEHNLEDFFLDFEIRIPKGPVDSEYGVLFRTARNGGELPTYYALMFFPKENMIAVACWEHTSWTWWKKVAWKIDVDKEIPVRLEVVGKQFRVFINNTYQFEATDEALPAPGLICLTLVSRGAQENTVYFQKLRVYKTGP